MDGVSRNRKHLDAAFCVQVHVLDLPHDGKPEGSEIKKKIVKVTAVY